jgi:hypothetical protein
MTVLAIIAALLSSPVQGSPAPQPRGFLFDVHEFAILGQTYDPENPGKQESTYYRTVDQGGLSFIRAVYTPPQSTVTLFHSVPDELRHGVRRVQWRWRAQILPRKGNECAPDLGDSAAAVYITWKRGMRWYSLKFVWSSEAPAGATCNRIRNPLVASDSIVLRTGPGNDGWVEENVDPEELFRQHFTDGDPGNDIPDLQGIGLMSDGDQTRSTSAADYAGFVLYK